MLLEVCHFLAFRRPWPPSFERLLEALALTSAVNCGGRTLPPGNILPDASGGIGAPTAASVDAGVGADSATTPGPELGDVAGGDSPDPVPNPSCDGEADCGSDAVAARQPRPCTPTDAAGVGAPGFSSSACNTVLGWGWDGTKCIAILGCSCQGADCGSLLSVKSECSAAYANCM
jgi:hypothetical protein